MIEDKIGEQAIKFVAEKLGISIAQVRLVHDFQWELVYNTVQKGTGKGVYMEKWMAFVTNNHKIFNNVKKKMRDIESLEKSINYNSPARFVHVTKGKIKALQEDIDHYNSKIVNPKK